MDLFFNSELIDLKLISLVCLPYAGGSSRIFYEWNKFLPINFQLIPLELRGRSKRIKESFYQNLDELFDELLNYFKQNIKEEFIIFGHSMGALIGFELTNLLSIIDLKPRLLVVSACQPPKLRIARPKSSKASLSDEELIKVLKKLNGVPQEVLDNKEFMAFYLPIIKNDFYLLEQLDERFRKQEIKVQSPILAIGANSDPEIPLQTIEGWRQCTEKSFHKKKFQGDHFFINDQPQRIISTIEKTCSIVERERFGS